MLPCISEHRSNRHIVRLPRIPIRLEVTEFLEGEERETAAHGWGRVPFIPLRNNDKEMTDLELVKGLIDAYDYISSEGTNNLRDMVDLY